MSTTDWKDLLRGAALAICLGTPLAAATDDRMVIAIGVDDYGGPRAKVASKDARAITDALFGQGFEPIRRQNVLQTDTLEFNDSVDLLVLYFAGRVQPEGDDLRLLTKQVLPTAPEEELAEGEEAPIPEGWMLSEVLENPFGVEAKQLIAVIETCSAEDGTPIEGFTIDEGALGEGIAVLGSTLNCVDAREGEMRATDALLKAADEPGAELIEAIRNVGIEPLYASLTSPVVLQPKKFAPVVPVLSLNRAPAPVVAPVIAPITIAPVENVVVPASAPANLAIAAEPLDTALQQELDQLGPRDARPIRPGFPRPSIILGYIRAPEAEPEEIDPLAEFDFTDRSARIQLRIDQPEVFSAAVLGGRFDPPGDLTRAIQTELEIQRCYLGGVDGQWGNGSRRGVDAFRDQAKVELPGRDPSIDLFRAIISGPEVQCPQVARATTPRATTTTRTRTTTTRTQTRTQTQTAPAARTTTRPRQTFSRGSF